MAVAIVVDGGVRDAGADDAREAAREVGLHFAGDWVPGEARIHAALRSGLDLGERLQDGSS